MGNPLPIPTPTPADGFLVRKPRSLVYIDGVVMPYVLELSTTRGLDQEVGTADITYPYPLPDTVRMWAKVQILIGVDDPDPMAPYQGIVERFVGYVVSVGGSLWPGARTIHCEDLLALAKYTFTPTDMDLSEGTDVQAIIRILNPPTSSDLGGVGLGADHVSIEGLNKLLVDFSDVTIKWEVGVTAMEVIKMIDAASLGYRTFCTAGGRVIRRLIPTDPNTVSYLWHFQEGVDILDGSESSEIKDAKNEITVTGFDEDYQHSLPPDEDPFYWRTNSYWIRFLFLKASIGGTAISPTDVAAYILSQINKNIIKVTFSTHLGILFNGQEVVKVTSPRLEVDNNFWVQSVQATVGADGDFTQTITCVSELADDVNRGVLPPPVITPQPVVPGVPVVITPVPPTPIPPGPGDITVAFTLVGTDSELAAPADEPDNTGGLVYGISVADHSTSRQGQIVGRAWVATGPGVTVESGSGPTFTTAFSDLDGAEIKLTVEDNHGSTKSLTQSAHDGVSPIRTRKLYACTDTTMEAFDGTVWRSQVPSGAEPVQVVGGGPFWGCGNKVYTTEDDLATDATATECWAATGEIIKCIWVHGEAASQVWVGGDKGTIAVSLDKALTWEIRQPAGFTEADPLVPISINHIQVDPLSGNDVYVVTNEGWFDSHDGGQDFGDSSHRAPNANTQGDFVYFELGQVRQIIVQADGVLREITFTSSTPYTGNTSPIVAATTHIREDLVYAIAEDGTTWYTTDPGSFALTQGADIPAGEPYVAGLIHDPMMPDLLYFAAQDGGLFKTLDGFKSAEGYLRLRAIGRLTP